MKSKEEEEGVFTCIFSDWIHSHQFRSHPFEGFHIVGQISVSLTTVGQISCTGKFINIGSKVTREYINIQRIQWSSVSKPSLVRFGEYNPEFESFLLTFVKTPTKSLVS